MNIKNVDYEKEKLETMDILQNDNEKIRKELDELIGINNPMYSPLWLLINKLVENEIEQEEMCGE